VRRVSTLLGLGALGNAGFLAQAEIPAIASPETGAETLPAITILGELPQADATSTTVISGSKFNIGGLTGSRDITALTPNLTVFDANNDRIPKFSVRGLRENNFSVGEPILGFYVDDVPYTDLTTRGVSLYDIERVELLRGPQGTLYGASGPGGVINVRTRVPGNAWRGQAAVGYGSYNEWSARGGVSGPILQDRLAFGVSGLWNVREGFIENRTLGTRPDEKETLAGRAQLRWTPSDPWEVLLTVSGERLNDGFVPTYDARSDVNPYTVNRDTDGFVDTQGLSQSLKLRFETPSVKVVNTATHRTWSQDLLQDFDFSPVPIRLGFTAPDMKQWSDELRVESPEDDGPLRWLGGLYFVASDLRNDSGSVELYSVPLPGPTFTTSPTTFRTLSELDSDTYAAFGQATYTIWDKLDLTAGIRLTYDQRAIRRVRTIESPAAFFGAPGPGGFPIGPLNNAFGSVETDGDFSATQPRFAAAWHFTQELQAYASVASGYQSGGFNYSNDSAALAAFNPARSWHYEAGLKSAWLEGRLEAGISGFHIETDGYQVHRFSTVDPSQAFIINADRATSLGAELEMIVRPADGLELDASLGWVDAQFDRFTDPVNGTSLSGGTINFTPQFTANLGIEYRLPCNAYFRVDYVASGEFYLDEANTARQGAYGLLNARIGYDWKHLGIQLFGRNLLGQEYFRNALDMRSAVDPNLLVRQVGDPLVIGLALTGRF
jgi:iron complex outermembrane receptor protein